jgi:hypothetical protein
MHRIVGLRGPACTLALFCATSGVLAQTAPTGPIRVAVITATGTGDQFGDPDQRQRIDSVKDLRSQLRAKRGIKIVNPDQQPDVQIEVLRRRRQFDGGTVGAAVPVFGGAVGATEATKENVLRVRLTVVGKDYVAEIVDAADTWTGAARNVAGTIAAWVKDNMPRLRPRPRKD